MGYVVSRLTSDNAGLASDFHVSPNSCENPEYYEEYIKLNAIGDHQKGMGVTHVLLDEEQKRLLGFITLRATSLVSEGYDGVKNVHPALEIAELAVEEKFERQGVGTTLLALAIDIADELRSNMVGIRHIVVCADKAAVGFYQKFGFGKLSSLYEVLHDGWNDLCEPLCITLPEMEFS